MKNLAFLFFILFVFFNCQSDPVSSRTEIGNFEYWHHIKNEGEKPSPGQVVFYHYQITKGGQLVQGNFGEDPSGGILVSEEEAKANPQAIGEAVRRMAVGDSLTIIYPQDDPDSNMVYDVVLRSFYSR